MTFEILRFGDVTVLHDRIRIPLSAMERAKRQGQYRYYGAQGVIDHVDDYLFDGTYLLIAEDGENLKSNKQNIAQIVTGQFWVNNHAHIVQTTERCNLQYLCYLLNLMDISGYITGSAQPKLSQANLNAIELSLPSREHQDQIVTILRLLDNKIELNNQINENLEQQIQAIYCYYYGTAAHAPSGELSSVCHYSAEKVRVSDLSLSTYYSTENMQPNRGGAVDASSLPSIAQTTKCRKGDVLVSNIRPYFKKIVYVNETCGCSTDVLCFSPNSKKLSPYLFATLYADKFFDYMTAGAKGTKMPRGDKQQIMKYPIMVPSEDSLNSFNAVVEPMLELIAYNRNENKRLVESRDALLPKLMSGELDVSNL